MTLNAALNGQPLVEARHLKQYFNITVGMFRSRPLKAVDDVSFAIRKGETLGLVGESGCGKTTVGRSLLHLYKPTGGEVLFEGRPIRSKDDINSLHKKATMVFQDPYSSLNPRMTVEEIIGDGLKRRGMKDATERHAKIVDMLQHVGLMAEHATRYPHEFSGGQRQRIGIARALAVDPTLIIADEPVSALDVSVQAQIINLINSLKSEFGLTILFIAHNLSVVKYFCDRIGVMYYGKLVESASSDELFANPVHPYTRALLSAIPLPDPLSEKRRVKINYDPSIHQYTDVNPPAYHTVAEGHQVYGTEAEIREWTELVKGGKA